MNDNKITSIDILVCLPEDSRALSTLFVDFNQLPDVVEQDRVFAACTPVIFRLPATFALLEAEALDPSSSDPLRPSPDMKGSRIRIGR